jgi:hypothetical protein
LAQTWEIAKLVLVLAKASLFIKLPFGTIDTLLEAVIMDAMKPELAKNMRKPLLLAVLTVVCFAVGAQAQPCLATDTTCTLELTGPPPGPSMAGFYIDPYTALIGQAGQTVPPINGVSTSVICDDFEASISTSTPPWQANQITLGALLASDSGGGAASTAVKFDQGANAAAAQALAYVEGAYLATQIFAQAQANNTTAQGEYTYAIWELFDPGVALNWLANNNNDQGAAAAQAGTYLGQALQFAQSFNGNYSTLSSSQSCLNCLSMFIYTPTQAGIQELDAFATVAPGAVSAPEPSATALLAVYLSGLIGLIFVFRKRVVRSAS